MKLPDGVVIHVGGRRYKGQLPDNKITAKLNKGKLQKKLKAQEEVAKKAAKSEESKAH